MPYLRILAAAAIWGSIGVAGRIAFGAGVDPLETAFFRAAIAFLAIAAGVAISNRPLLHVRRGDLWLFAAFGTVSIAAFFFVYLYAISRTSVATAAILLYTAPIWVIVLSSVLFREPLTRGKVLAVVLAFAGCALVVRGYDPQSLRLNLSGVLAGLASGFTYGMYSIFGKTALRRYSPLTTLVYALGIGAAVLGGAAAAAGVISVSHSATAWAAIVYLSLVTTLLAQWLYLSGLGAVEAGRASLVATFEPVVAAVLGYAALGELLEGWQIVGGLLVLSAVLTVGRLGRAAASPPAAPPSPP
ncbi:MAG TPA: EamA family transporter [bacterium]|nr:EamA family transporter [bacterium]